MSTVNAGSPISNRMLAIASSRIAAWMPPCVTPWYPSNAGSSTNSATLVRSPTSKQRWRPAGLSGEHTKQLSMRVFMRRQTVMGPVEAGPMTVFLNLVILRLDLIEARWILACRALDRWLGSLVHIPALAADPDDLVFLLEDRLRLDFLEEFAVPFLVMGFSYRNGTQAHRDCLVALLISNVSEAWIHRGRLIMLTVDGRLQILSRSPQYERDFSVCELQHATVLCLDVLQKFKQDPGMNTFLISGQ